jgi:hypothetical protein
VRDGNLRSIFARNITEAHWQPVETWSTGQGVPDTEYCLDGATGWIEFKRVTGWRVDLAPFQVAWLLRRHRAGGTVLVASRKDETLWLHCGSQAAFLAKERVDQVPPVLVTTGGPAAWDWQAVKEAMKKK